MDKSARLVQRFLNSRARVTHLGGHALVSAWLYDIQMPYGWISCHHPLAIGEDIQLLIQGENESANVKARIIDADRGEMRNRETPVFLERGNSIPYPLDYCYQFEFMSTVRPVPNKDTDRKAVSSMVARVGTMRFERMVLLADVSVSGARILSTEPIESGELLSFEFEQGGKTIAISASGRYLRRESSNRDLYSAGLRFEGVGRIDTARWKMILHEASAKPARAPHTNQSLSPVLEAVEGGQDFQNIAKKLLAKIQEVDKAERDFLRKHLEQQQGSLDEISLRIFEAHWESMARHKQQFSDNLSAAIEILHSQVVQNRRAA